MTARFAAGGSYAMPGPLRRGNGEDGCWYFSKQNVCIYFSLDLITLLVVVVMKEPELDLHTSLEALVQLDRWVCQSLTW